MARAKSNTIVILHKVLRTEPKSSVKKTKGLQKLFVFFVFF